MHAWMNFLGDHDNITRPTSPPASNMIETALCRTCMRFSGSHNRTRRHISNDWAIQKKRKLWSRRHRKPDSSWDQKEHPYFLNWMEVLSNMFMSLTKRYKASMSSWTSGWLNRRSLYAVVIRMLDTKESTNYTCLVERPHGTSLGILKGWGNDKCKMDMWITQEEEVVHYVGTIRTSDLPWRCTSGALLPWLDLVMLTLLKEQTEKEPKKFLC